MGREELDKMWGESERDLAISFLKRAVRIDMTMEDLITVLSFPHIKPHLASIDLSLFVAPKSSSAVQRTGLRAARAHTSRQAMLAKKREMILQVLRRAPAGLTSPEVRVELRRLGHATSSSQVYHLLRLLLADAQVVSAGDRVKTWQLSHAGVGGV